MSLHGGKVPKDKAQILTQQFLHFFDYWIRTTAMNAFEVAVFEERDRRIRTSASVIAFRNRVF